MGILPWLWQLALATLFTFSATAKSLSFHNFRLLLQYTLGLDALKARLVAIAVVIAEFVVAVAGVASSSSHSIEALYFTSAIALLVAFIGWQVWVIRRGFSVRCQCFGANSALVSWRAVIRNGGLSALTIAAAWLVVGTEYETSIPESAVRAVLALTAVGLAAGFAAFQFVHPYLLTTALVQDRLSRAAGSDR